MESEGYLHVPETTGRTLLFTPIPVHLILKIGRIPDMKPSEGSVAFFASRLMMPEGFFYAVIRGSTAA